jgi:hypothetical protein
LGNDEFDDLENRLWFIRQVITPDDTGEFIDLLLQMNCSLAYALHEFTNLETVFEQHPEVKKTMKNLTEFRLRMLHKDTRIIELEKFDLFK